MKSPIFAEKCSVLLRARIGRKAKANARCGILSALATFPRISAANFAKPQQNWTFALPIWRRGVGTPPKKPRD